MSRRAHLQNHPENIDPNIVALLGSLRIKAAPFIDVLCSTEGKFIRICISGTAACVAAGQSPDFLNKLIKSGAEILGVTQAALKAEADLTIAIAKHALKGNTGAENAK